jgi:hypothetical protein
VYISILLIYCRPRDLFDRVNVNCFTKHCYYYYIIIINIVNETNFQTDGLLKDGSTFLKCYLLLSFQYYSNLPHKHLAGHTLAYDISVHNKRQ